MKYAGGLFVEEGCDVLSPHEVRYRFKGERTRDLPLTVPHSYFLQGLLRKGGLLEIHAGAAAGLRPYKVKTFKPGEYVTYGRRDDYWGKDLPVNRGRYNFDEVRFDYFRERTAGFEALKSGAIDLREEGIA